MSVPVVEDSSELGHIRNLCVIVDRDLVVQTPSKKVLRRGKPLDWDQSSQEGRKDFWVGLGTQRG